jgi:hypothetical protein
MNVAKDREIIRLWNRLRLLKRKGRSVATVRRQIEKALWLAATSSAPQCHRAARLGLTPLGRALAGRVLKAMAA